MIRLLKVLYIVQEKKKDGRTLRRFNPYNPLTYLSILIIFIVALFLFGIKGIIEEVDWEDLKFKYR